MKNTNRAALLKVEASVSPVSRKWNNCRMATSASQKKREATSLYSLPGMHWKGTKFPTLLEYHVWVTDRRGRESKGEGGG